VLGLHLAREFGHGDLLFWMLRVAWAVAITQDPYCGLIKLLQVWSSHLLKVRYFGQEVGQ
jgi:hypothetical protein